MPKRIATYFGNHLQHAGDLFERHVTSRYDGKQLHLLETCVLMSRLRIWGPLTDSAVGDLPSRALSFCWPFGSQCWHLARLGLKLPRYATLHSQLRLFLGNWLSGLFLLENKLMIPHCGSQNRGPLRSYYTQIHLMRPPLNFGWRPSHGVCDS